MAVAINHRKQASFVIRHSSVLNNELRSLQVVLKAHLIVKYGVFWGKVSKVG